MSNNPKEAYGRSNRPKRHMPKDGTSETLGDSGYGGGNLLPGLLE